MQNLSERNSFIHSFIVLLVKISTKNTPADTDATEDYTKSKITLLIGNVMGMNNSSI